MKPLLCTAIITLMLTMGTVNAQTQARGSVSVADGAPGTNLLISPAAEPDPALRYQFWPPLHQQKPINAMPFFSRAVLMATSLSLRQSEFALTRDRDDRWLGSKWKPEYADEVSEFLAPYRDSFAELERATDCMQIDYPIVDSSLSIDQMYGLLLPEVQESRALARLLRLRAKLEMHSGRWEDFTRTMQTMFRLSEMVGQAGDLLISRLVGLAIAGLAGETIEEASAISGCPNFYWALAALPHGLLDFRGAIEQELLVLPNLTPGLATNPDTPIGAVAARDKIAEIIRAANELQLLSDNPHADQAKSLSQLTGGLVVIAVADQSRAYLRDQTRWGHQVDELSDSECVLRAFAIEVERATSNILKWSWLPDSIRLKHAEKGRGEMRRLDDLSKSEINPAANLLGLALPGTSQVFRAEYRGKQSIAFQATTQAFRDFAAAHKCLPESLDELNLPAWPDPTTQKPFAYVRTTPQTATLTRGKHYPGDKNTTVLLELTE